MILQKCGKRSPQELQVTNWSGEPLNIQQGTAIGNIKEVLVVNINDPVWKTPTVEVARIRQGSKEETRQRQAELKLQLVINDTCSEEEWIQFKEFLLIRHSSFAKEDTELGETNMVEHSIDTGVARPTYTFSCRLPYALRMKIEEQLTKLKAAGSINKSIRISFSTCP